MNIFDEWATRFLDRTQTVNLNRIQNDAKQYFSNSSSSSMASEKHASSEESAEKSVSSAQLALLISKMGEPLSSKFNTPKVRALKCLLGATEALQGGDQGEGISLNMVELMARFLIEHCGPISSDFSVYPSSENESTYNNLLEDATVENVRDVALECICSLIQIHHMYVESTGKDESIQIRASLAMEAVRKRCASIEDEEDDDMVNGFSGDENTLSHEKETRVLSGLSLLPRAKRSLCFRALESSLRGISADLNFHVNQELSLDSKSVNLLINFTNFTSSCLHGESDPRCLIQMLKLLKQIQLVILPCFLSSSALHSNKSNDSTGTDFPFLAIFDAVAPYYPIKFTPPPSDPWGITREALHDELLEVLICCTHLDVETSTSLAADIDGNMVVLATRLFIERLSPPSIHPFDDHDDDEITTVQDRIDALEDLTRLLLLPLDSSSCLGQNAEFCPSNQKKQSWIFSNLSYEVVKEMSNAIVRCHEDASTSAVSASNSEDQMENKKLANLCRNFITRISYEFEFQLQSEGLSSSQIDNGNRNASFWDCFVSQQVRDLSGILSSSPQSVKGRVAIAYIASLSACGGERTLRLCLEKCIPPLLGILRNGNDGLSHDDEQMSTAANGIGAFFSSSRLSMEQISRDGIVVYPHPLQDFIRPIVQLFCKIANRDDASLELKIAVIKALESILISSPFYLMEKEDVDFIRNTILYLSKGLTEETSDHDIHGQVESEWKLACAQLLGTTIGRATKRKEEGVGTEIKDVKRNTLLEEDTDIITLVRNTLFPTLLSSCSQYHVVDKENRYDWKIFALACEAGKLYVSELVMSRLFQDLKEAIEMDIQDHKRIQNIAAAMAFILQHGGDNPRLAFHSKSLQMEIVYALSYPPSQIQQDAEMSTLLLPEIRDKKRTEADKAVQLAYSILPLLLMAYYKCTPHDKIEALLSFTTQVLPPLSEWDNTKLCVVLPILSIILAGESNLDMKSSRFLATSLVEFVLTRYHHHIARIAAGSCIFSILSKQPQDDPNPIGLEIMIDMVSPSIVTKLKSFQDESSEGVDTLNDTINLLALIGSASACRGSSSSKLADDVAKSLAHLACEGTMHSPSLGIKDLIDCKRYPINIQKKVSVAAGNALGSVLNVKSGNPFWRQRISHHVLPIVLSSPRSSKGATFGKLLCACHLICCISLPALGEKRMFDLTSLIVNGIEVWCTNVASSQNGDREPFDQDLRIMLMSSLLKIMNDSTQSVMYHIRTILPGILLTLKSLDEIDEVPSHLISLQILANIAAGISLNREAASFCQSYKHTITKHLTDLLDHPSFQVRQAAGNARNLWFVMNP